MLIDYCIKAKSWPFLYSSQAKNDLQSLKGLFKKKKKCAEAMFVAYKAWNICYLTPYIKSSQAAALNHSHLGILMQSPK